MKTVERRGSGDREVRDRALLITGVQHLSVKTDSQDGPGGCEREVSCGGAQEGVGGR